MLSVFLSASLSHSSVLTDNWRPQWGVCWFTCEVSSLTLCLRTCFTSGLSWTCPRFPGWPTLLERHSHFLFLFYHCILYGFLPFCSLLLASKQGQTLVRTNPKMAESPVHLQTPSLLRRMQRTRVSEGCRPKDIWSGRGAGSSIGSLMYMWCP